jgi:hypothetical protein
MLHFNVIVRQVMTVSSERIFWYLFNGFLHVDNFVVELFSATKMLEMSPGRWFGGTVGYPAQPGLICQSVSPSVSLCVHACRLGI